MFKIANSEILTIEIPQELVIQSFNEKDFNNLFLIINQDILLDFKNLEIYDSFAIYFVKEIKLFCEKNNYKCTIINQKEDFQKLYSKLSNYKKQVYSDEENNLKSSIMSIGKKIISLYKDGIAYVEFIGSVIINVFNITTFKEKLNFKDIIYLTQKNGVNALPIIILILLLIGMISGYQGALMLKQFGADIFIADLIGISITRELSPLMVAIIIAGRSGSSFTAEIGTMKISDEIDAFKTMGFNIYNFIVLPKIVALFIAIPILILIGDIAGILGGLIAAMTTLDLTMNAYFTELKTAVTIAGIFSGAFKGLVFAFVISTVACFRGLQVSGGAESVGHFTTSSVVTSIFLIILLDAVFTYTFQLFGI